MRARAWLALAAILAMVGTAPGVPESAPPNAPASIEVKGALISISYHGRMIFQGRVLNPDELRQARTAVSQTGDAVHQTLTLHSKEWNKPVVVEGLVEAGMEAFPCESDPRPRGLDVVRHVSGLSCSLLNNAVYDRTGDWAFSVDDPWRSPVRVMVKEDGPSSRSFHIRAEGNEIILRFRPRFYQRHRGLADYEPWTYSVWPQSVAGWCSWFAFFDAVTEGDVKRTADVLAEVLAPFGFEYLQIDDGYQRALGAPESWLIPNDKFPGGLESLASYIKDRGLKPGLWTSTGFADKEFVEKHKSWFVQDANGQPARGNWVQYVIDGSVPDVLNNLVRPLYKELRRTGWEYFKVDTLRHVRYEGYNSFAEHFARKKVERVDAFRALVRAVRDEVGRERFLLGCWGVRPELVGLIDGCRIGTDGFSFAGLSQYNSFNNVVWRNDPDHIELSDQEAYRSTMVTSLTGSLMMLTDKPERYRTRYAEPAKRSAPVLFTRPGQVYDVDPSRSQHIGRADAETSGKEPKIFDAGLTPRCHLFALEVVRPWGSWLVLGRTGGDFDGIRFQDLGLSPDKEYLVFEFWEKRLLGAFSGGFSPGPINPAFNCQVFIIREKTSRPQVLATSRHITGGGVDMLALAYEGDCLKGQSKLVARDPYEIYFYLPQGYALEGFSCPAATISKPETFGPLTHVSLVSETSAEIEWRANFK